MNKFYSFILFILKSIILFCCFLLLFLVIKPNKIYDQKPKYKSDCCIQSMNNEAEIPCVCFLKPSCDVKDTEQEEQEIINVGYTPNEFLGIYAEQPIYNIEDDIIDFLIIKVYNINQENYNKEDGLIFLKDVLCYAKFLNETSIPLVALLAQSYTEGGAGKLNSVYAHSNNLFGIRATSEWNGLVYSRKLNKVFINYAAAADHQDLFRAYYTMEESIEDYINLITTSSRYKNALNKSYDIYLYALLQNGYGEKHMYDTWLAVIKTYKIEKLIFE